MTKGSKKGAFWVESLTSSPLTFVGMITAVEDMVYDTSGYGVLDLGAAETVGLLEALESLMTMRSQARSTEFNSMWKSALPIWKWWSSVQL